MTRRPIPNVQQACPDEFERDAIAEIRRHLSLNGPVAKALHRNNTWWNEAPIPPLEHQCVAATVGLMSNGAIVVRCACGGIRRADPPGHHWTERNDRITDPRRRDQQR